ncbi:MAG TPA: methyltransferase domain-containing protein [Candidatus Polarisedimenticolia bacterium]|nr:methyltransferase domain-containing protein [Candidatus Polarisedimenticolia bacterium]
MADQFANVYADAERAKSYARLGYPGTYYLAFRDIPELLRRHIQGRQALDFGCGTGRSTRFLKDLGFHTTGIDIAEPMLREARASDPQGDYLLASAGQPPELPPDAYDLILAAFTFDNIPTGETKTALFRALGRALSPGGRIVLIVSTPEIYWHEWLSFSTKDFPENRQVPDGGRVRIVMLDVPDRRPVEDIVWSDRAYRKVFRDAGLRVIQVHQPLGLPGEPFPWMSEVSVPAWTVYVLSRADRDQVAG